MSVTADAQGNFTIHLTGIPAGETDYTVTATAPHYQSAHADVYVTSTISPGAYKASAASIPYNQLTKDPSALAGRVVTYSAQVFQYDTNTTTKHFIASVTDSGYGFWTDNIWVDVDPTVAQNVCKGTVINLWGEVVGPYSYTTVNANTTLTIPEINVKYIDVVSGGC